MQRYYLEGPTDPRYAALAKQIAAKVPAAYAGDPFATALTVKLWLDDELTYSTKHRHAGVPDSTADFLFGDRTGYCVHFAHAAVLLWRALGIPARIGTGYRTEEDDRHGSSTILVRASDAHAWPELYLDGIGWVVLDIAAKKVLDEPPPPVDSDLQRLLGEMARQMPPDPTRTTLTEGSPLAFGKDLARAVLLAAAAALVLLYITKIWRRIAVFVVRPHRLPVAGYRLALDHLAEIGITRRFGETREAFARRAAPVAPLVRRAHRSPPRRRARRSRPRPGLARRALAPALARRARPREARDPRGIQPPSPPRRGPRSRLVPPRPLSPR